MGVFEFTSEHGEKNPVSFHMPGHKGSQLYSRFGFDDFLKDFPDRDITEIAGADNLFQPEGIIADTMSKYRSLYDTKATYLLINGSSGGLIASMMTCVGPGEKIIMARNCHKAVFNALRLGNIEPVYVYPEMIRAYGIAGRVMPEDVETAIRENPDAKAIILPSPNYYGVCSDIKALAELAHEAGMYLIVDQAHGAHLKFFERAAQVIDTLTIPKSAETSGADLVINSTHKTLGTLTQSAILNVCADTMAENCGEMLGAGDAAKMGVKSGDMHVDLFDLEDRLQMIESTSPSYILMESLDINADILAEHGDQLIDEWYEELQRFYREVRYVPGLKAVRPAGLDPTKINLDMSRIGLDGATLDEELRERGIFAELSTGNILMCMTGIGNSTGDYDRLLDALKEIAWKYGREYISKMSDMEMNIITWREGMEGFEEEEPKQSEKEDAQGSDVVDNAVSDSVWTARREIHQIPVKKELIGLDDAQGRICATALIPYPPGIPLICPGESITGEDIEYISELRSNGEKVIGVDPEGRISVGL